jgi:hypothetical protein
MICLSLSACREVKLKEIVKGMRGEKFMQSANTGAHRIQLRYVPKILRVYESGEADSNAEFPPPGIDTLALRQMTRGILFVMQLGPSDTSGNSGFKKDLIYGAFEESGDYRKNLAHYQFGLAEKIWLESNRVRYPLANYQMENSFGMFPERTFTLFFPDIPNPTPGKPMLVKVVLDDIVPGLGRKQFTWAINAEKYEYSI